MTLSEAEQACGCNFFLQGLKLTAALNVPLASCKGLVPLDAGSTCQGIHLIQEQNRRHGEAGPAKGGTQQRLAFPNIHAPQLRTAEGEEGRLAGCGSCPRQRGLAAACKNSSPQSCKGLTSMWISML